MNVRELLTGEGAKKVVVPWSDALQVELLSISDGMASARVPYGADRSNAAGGIATGVVATLVDHACGAAVLTKLSRRVSISTLNLKIDHLRSPHPDCQITASARCCGLSGNIALVRADVWDRNPDDVFAAAQAVFSLNRAIDQ